MSQVRVFVWLPTIDPYSESNSSLDLTNSRRFISPCCPSMMPFMIILKKINHLCLKVQSSSMNLNYFSFPFSFPWGTLSPKFCCAFLLFSHTLFDLLLSFFFAETDLKGSYNEEYCFTHTKFYAISYFSMEVQGLLVYHVQPVYEYCCAVYFIYKLVFCCNIHVVRFSLVVLDELNFKNMFFLENNLYRLKFWVCVSIISQLDGPFAFFSFQVALFLIWGLICCKVKAFLFTL